MTKTEDILCPLCRSQTAKSFVRVWREYRLYDCPDCGGGFCDPFRNPGESYYAHFEDLYPNRAQTTTDPMSLEYDECLRFLRRDKPRGKRLLDVGCGGGGFLNRARGEGFEVSGLDFNKTRLEAIRAQLGIETVYYGSLTDFARSHPSRRFDVITLFQVLEHLDDPGLWLDAAHFLLEPEGVLFIGVPNRERTFDPFRGPGMEEIDNPPHHLTRWSARSLKGILERHSFHVVEVKSLEVPLPLLALMLRNALRLGIATKALKVDQLQHIKEEAGLSARSRQTVIRGLVTLKERTLNSLAWAIYPVFRLAGTAFGWQGVVLVCAARRKI
ncbi:MAG: class I SAM-dependent methyltransferase [Elusimicrobia bacterium]|nr:class I SAM-dependent methyltransferase [Elusimicrobiota bacterium]